MLIFRRRPVDAFEDIERRALRALPGSGKGTHGKNSDLRRHADQFAVCSNSARDRGAMRSAAAPAFIRQKPAQRAQHAAQGRMVGLNDGQLAAQDHSGDHRRYSRAGDRAGHIAAERRDRTTTIDDGRRKSIYRLAERRRVRANHHDGGKHRGHFERSHCALSLPKFRAQILYIAISRAPCPKEAWGSLRKFSNVAA